MRIRRKLGLVAVLVAVAASSLTLMATGTASAAGKPGLLVTDNCGGTLVLKERVVGTLIIDITEFSADPSEVWSMTATQQEYNITTGGRQGAPINLIPNPMPPLAFSTAEGGFSTTANITDTPNVTHGFSYVATRTSPTPLTCTGEGFWTDHNGSLTPDPLNPTQKPDTPPVLTGNNEADSGTNVVAMQFDQEMLDTAQGTPAPSRFAVTVNGAAEAVTSVAISNDSPPNKAVVSLTLGGAALPANGTVTVQYRQPLSSSDPQLQDLDSLLTSGYGPITIPVF